MAPASTAPPGLQEATRNSTAHWQDDLQSLFDHAKDRFADVVWELNSDSGKGIEEVWGHKGLSSFSSLFPPSPIVLPRRPTVPARSDATRLVPPLARETAADAAQRCTERVV